MPIGSATSDRSVILLVGQEPLARMTAQQLCPDQARRWRSRRIGPLL